MDIRVGDVLDLAGGVGVVLRVVANSDGLDVTLRMADTAPIEAAEPAHEDDADDDEELDEDADL